MANLILNTIECSRDVMNIIRSVSFENGIFSLNKVIPVSDGKFKEAWGADIAWNETAGFHDMGNSFDFYTQNRPALKVIEKLSKMVGEHEFTYDFCDLDDRSPAIRMIWSNGQMIRKFAADRNASELSFSEVPVDKRVEVPTNEDTHKE